MDLREAAGRAFDLLRGRRLAYQLTFRKENYEAQRVLIDLAKFCRASETTFHPDARISAVLEGRREVWLRIANHLNLTSEQLFALYRGNQFDASTRNLSAQGENDA